jgi:ribonucleoside-diphosphate reductase alpha chain
MGHLKMLGAVQPFISGAISKTINMPEDSTPEEIMDAYIEGWRLDLKAVAIYRDNCKRSQPLSTSRGSAVADGKGQVSNPQRRKLPDERQALTHKFSINGNKGYLTVGLFEDGMPGELFIVMAKEGSTISGLMDSFATAISISLQYGVPLQTLINKFTHTRFEPSGFTNKFLSRARQQAAGVVLREPEPEPTLGVETLTNGGATHDKVTFLYQQDAPSCHDCGAIMVRNGSCYKCIECGSTSGCS